MRALHGGGDGDETAAQEPHNEGGCGGGWGGANTSFRREEVGLDPWKRGKAVYWMKDLVS
jgi:hypothetical protein